jgi:ribonuclease E
MGEAETPPRLETPRHEASPAEEPTFARAAADEPPAPAPMAERAPSHAPEPPPAYVNPLPEAAVDPARPKRTGWWARAKQTLGGN